MERGWEFYFVGQTIDRVDSDKPLRLEPVESIAIEEPNFDRYPLLMEQKVVEHYYRIWVQKD